jgi:hypothetical protein
MSTKLKLENVVPTLGNAINEVLDGSKTYKKLDLLRHVPNDHAFKQLSMNVAEVCDLPPSTVFLMGVGVYSGATMLKYSVAYEDGETLPIGVNVAAEQPSGTSKSRAMKVFQKPFRKTLKQLLKETEAEQRLIKNNPEQLEVVNEKHAKLTAFMPITDATSESLDGKAIATGGFVALASSEQGLFNSLLGLSYGDSKKANNNDFLLNAYDGGFINSARAGRKGYTGDVVGSIVMFAQDGGIANVIASSKGTGVSGRFLCIAEPNLLGFRDHSKHQSMNKNLLSEYEKCCEFAKSAYLEANLETLDMFGTLRIKNSDWSKIYAYQNEIEPFLKDGGKFSHNELRGAVNKVKSQIMKVAANLYISSGAEIGTYGGEIESQYIDAAIGIVSDLLNGLHSICITKGIIGICAEFESILRMFEHKRPHDTITNRQIKQSRSTVEPFKNYAGNKSAAIQSALDEMVNQGLLLFDAEIKGYSLAG